MEPQTDLLTEQEFIRTPATPGLRFVNYLIDVVVFYAVMFLVGIAAAGIINPASPGPIYLLSFAIIIGYYTVMEGATGGKTVGKLVTKTRAVKEDGTTLTFGDAFLRTLCRLVPFEPLSIFFGDGMWHDRWSKTRVIKE